MSGTARAGSPRTAAPRWWGLGRGDVDATVIQVAFNIAQAVIPVFLLLPIGFSLQFSMAHIVPGYALGFLVGSAGLVYLALRLRKRDNRSDVTAQVYGNSTPAIIAYTLAIMLPVYLQSRDAVLAWQVGAAAVIWTGIIKLAIAPFAGTIRRLIPVPASMAVFGAAMYSYLGLVLLQRLFDQPLVGIIGLTIVGITILSNIQITHWRIPPILAAWLVPLTVALAIGYVHPTWEGMAITLPLVASLAPLEGLGLAVPYLSVIAPITTYQILQDIAAVEGAAGAGDDYDARAVVGCDGIGTLVCGVAGSPIAPILFAMHPPYKAMGARVGFAVWSPLIFLFVVVTGITVFIAQLFPWPILAAIIAYVSVGVAMATLRRVPPKHLTAVMLGFLLPAGAVVSAALSSALPALKLSASHPDVLAALNRAIYWDSIQGLGNGFAFLVLVVAAVITEMIDRRPLHAAVWCLVAGAFSWLGLMHSATISWGAEPMYAAGWLAAAAIVFSSTWWAVPAPAPSTQKPAAVPTTAGVPQPAQAVP